MDAATVALALTTDHLLARVADYLISGSPVTRALLVQAAYEASRQVQPILARAGLSSELPGPQPQAEPHGALTRKLAGLPPEPMAEGGLARRLNTKEV